MNRIAWTIALIVSVTFASTTLAQNDTQRVIKLEQENKALKQRIQRMERQMNEMEARQQAILARLSGVGALMTEMGQTLAGIQVPNRTARVDQGTRTTNPNTTPNTTTTRPRIDRTNTNTTTTNPRTNTTPRTTPRVTDSNNTRPNTPVRPIIRTPDIFRQNTVGGTSGGVVASVDIVRVFNSLLVTAETEADFQIRKEQLNADAKERATNVRNMQLDLIVLKEGTPAHTNLKTRLEDETQKWHVWRIAARNQLNKSRSERMQDIYNKIITSVEGLAKGSGYDVIVYQEQPDTTDVSRYQSFSNMALTRKLVFSAQEQDLTDLVIRQMNAEHAQASR